MKLSEKFKSIGEKRKYNQPNLPDVLVGKVKYYNEKKMEGIIDGPEGAFYDIVLNPSDKKHQEWNKKIKKGMTIKYKIVDDPDFNQAIIFDGSFK